MNSTTEENDKEDESQQKQVHQDGSGKKRVEVHKEIRKEELQKDEDDKKIQFFDGESNELMVLEEISPIANQLDKLIESCNEQKKDLNWNILDENINQVDKDANLSPKKVDLLKAKLGKSKKKNKSSSVSSTTIHTRSYTAKIKP